MMSLSKFSGGGGTPLRTTWLTASTGTFTPLADTTWFHIIMCGAGGQGGTSSSGYNEGGIAIYSAGGKGGTAAVARIFWYPRESIGGTPIASYSYAVGSYSTFNTAWNTGNAGTQGQPNAQGGSNGGVGLGNYGSNQVTAGPQNHHQATAGESSLLGCGGAPNGGYGQGYGAGGGGGAVGYSSYGTYGTSPGGGGSLGVIVITEF